MLIEGLSFKLSLDFLRYLKKYRIVTSNIKLDFFDRSKHEYINFNNVSAVQSYYQDYYVPIDDCELGNLCSIQSFTAESDSFNFKTSFKVIDVTGNLKIESGKSFDLKRDAQRNILKQRQIDLLNKSITDYLKFYRQLKLIYVNGIYSPCYAESGWSENTWYLKSLREMLTASTSASKFPYTDIKIQKNPPKGGNSLTLI